MGTFTSENSALILFVFLPFLFSASLLNWSEVLTSENEDKLRLESFPDQRANDNLNRCHYGDSFHLSSDPSTIAYPVYESVQDVPTSAKSIRVCPLTSLQYINSIYSDRWSMGNIEKTYFVFGRLATAITTKDVATMRNLIMLQSRDESSCKLRRRNRECERTRINWAKSTINSISEKKDRERAPRKSWYARLRLIY